MKRVSVYIAMCLIACMFAFTATAQAGGFNLFEWGNAALGRGTAFYATGDDPSVVAYNPAQISRLKGTQVYGGVTLVTPASDVVVNGSRDAIKNQTFPVPHAYFTHQVNDDFYIGFGAFTRFGLGTKYEDHFTAQTSLREAMLESYSFNPTVAYKVTDDFTVAVGFELIKGSFLIKKCASGAFSNSESLIDVSGTSMAGNLGLLYEFNDMFSVGFSYRSPANFVADGDTEISGLPAGNGSYKTELRADFPSSWSLGLGFVPIEDLTIEFDAIYTEWEHFDAIEFDFTGLSDTTEDFYYKNTWRFQVGAEYRATENLALRAGYVYDQTPTRHDYASFMLPANDRNMFTLGAGYSWDNWTVDVAGMYLVTKERKGLDIDGYRTDYENGDTWGLGLSVGYIF